MAIKTVTMLKEDYTALLSQTEAILDEAQTANRSMAADEKSKYDAGITRLTEMKEEIDQCMRLESVQKPVFAMATPAAKPALNAQVSDHVEEPQMATVRDVNGMPRIESLRSYSKLTAFAATPKGHEQAYRAGQWLRATLYGDQGAAEWCRKNGVGVRAALSGGINTAGGALVPEELETAIITLREQYGLFRQVCNVTPMGSDTRNIPRRTGGLTAYFTAENTSGTETDSAWDNVQLVAKKLMVLTRLSSEVVEDAIIDLANDMATEIAYAFALKEDTVGFTGTGAASDGGIVGVLVKAVDASHTKAKVAAASTHDTLAEINSTDLLNLMAAVPQYAKPGSAFYCSPSAKSLIFDAIKIAGGGNTMDMLSQATTPSFLGYPIHITPVMADSPSTTYNGTVVLAFGNLRQAVTMGERRGIRVALSNEQYWEQDQIGIKGTERFDINAHDLGSTTVKSPFAVLVGTS